tara:strand:+ start:2164 stop:3867 length:1704 start_codon:yes stop_codon:yes gene_type:complete
MAVDRYERSARLLNVPNVTDVGSRQALQASQSLQQRLDNISKFALGKLQDKATQEGQMYGVKNAPTLEQITRAVQQNQNVNELFAEEGSVFGNAAREVQADLFRQDSVATFLNKATIAKEGIKEKLITYQDAENIANELQADVNATFDIISGINPEAAVKFNAQASKIGYEVINAARLKAASVEYENQKAQIEQFSNNYLDDFEANLFQNKDLVKTMIVTQDIRNDVVNAFGILREPKKEVELYKSENKIIQKYIVSQIAEKDTIMQFKDGTDKEFDEILKARNMEGNREAIVTAVLAKEKEMNEIVENAKKQKDAKNEEAVYINETDYFGNNSAGLTPTQFIKKQKELGKYYSLTQQEKIFKQPNEGEAIFTQVQTFENTLDQITLGRVGVSQIEVLYFDGEVTGKQYAELRKAYRKQDKYKIGNDIIKRRMGVVGNDLQIKEEIKIPLGKALETFADKVRELEEQGLAVDQVTIANELIGGELKELYKEIFDKDKIQFQSLTKSKINNVLPNDSIYKNITVEEILSMNDAQLDIIIEEVLKENPTDKFNNYKNRLRNLKVLNNDY